MKFCVRLVLASVFNQCSFLSVKEIKYTFFLKENWLLL